ncbi:MAG: pyruvate kinase [Sandaracinaceae bacterium]
MPDLREKDELDGLRARIRDLADAGHRLVEARQADVDRVHPSYRDSARNLLHYLALRQHDLRELQRTLHRYGVSSLGRSEEYVHATLRAVERALAALAGEPHEPGPAPAVTFDRGRALLTSHAVALLGPPAAGRGGRIMVTVDAEGTDRALLSDLLRAGMNLVRINCAKESPEAWAGLVARLREAEEETGASARVHVDLAGPNARTVALGEGWKAPALEVGDRLVLTTPEDRPTRKKEKPARVGVSLTEVLGAVEMGHAVHFDDGLLTGQVVARDDEGRVVVELREVCGGRAKVKANKGINLPDSDLPLPSLTENDLKALDTVVGLADTVGMSFVRCPEDVDRLNAALAERGAQDVGVVLKIETRGAFQRLPALLLRALQREAPVGVMLARGDMGVELGFARMSEVQEEVLWICEAAHVPVIWATQVLESLAKRGLPTRGEITDAAMAGRAECVMLNKGEHVVRTVELLADVLGRMDAHHHKKVDLLRALAVSRLD